MTTISSGNVNVQLLLIIALLIITSSLDVFAYSHRDLLCRGGVVVVAPNHVNSDEITSASGTGPVGAKVRNMTAGLQLGVGLTYMYEDNLGIDVSWHAPVAHLIRVQGYTVAEVKTIAPGITFHHYIKARKPKLKPYVGLGIRHVSYLDALPSKEFEAIYPSSDWVVNLSRKYGVSLVAGVDYWMLKDFALSGSATYIDHKTDLKMEGVGSSLGKGETLTARNLVIDPAIYKLSLTFIF